MCNDVLAGSGGRGDAISGPGRLRGEVVVVVGGGYAGGGAGAINPPKAVPKIPAS